MGLMGKYKFGNIDLHCFFGGCNHSWIVKFYSCCCSYNYPPDDREYRRNGYNGPSMTTNGIGTTPNSKANPFVEGSALQQEAESVVNAFLMNEANTSLCCME